MNLLKPDTTTFADYKEKGKFVLIWRTILCIVFLFFGLTAWTLFYDGAAALSYGISMFIGIGFLIYIHLTKNFKPILYFFNFFGLILISIIINVPDELAHIPGFVWGISLIIFSFTTIGKRTGWITVLILGGAYSVHFLLYYNDLFPKLRTLTQLEALGMAVETFLSLCLSAYFLAQHLAFTSYTEGQMSLANAELELQNQIIQRKSDENSILIKEIHHRVKNNLQIIISLLRMHREEVSSPEAQKDFDEAINRILSMALLHQQMYREKELSRFNLNEYVSVLVRDIIDSYKSNNQEINVDVKVKNVPLKLESIVPLGLLINELVSNSLKHAFQFEQKGNISLFIEPYENGFQMKYSDDGVWISENSELKGFGSELVEMLTEQLNGKLTRDSSTYTLLISDLA